MTPEQSEIWLSEKIREGNPYAAQLRATMDAMRQANATAYGEGVLDQAQRDKVIFNAADWTVMPPEPQATRRAQAQEGEQLCVCGHHRREHEPLEGKSAVCIHREGYGTNAYCLCNEFTAQPVAPEGDNAEFEDDLKRAEFILSRLADPIFVHDEDYLDQKAAAALKAELLGLSGDVVRLTDQLALAQVAVTEASRGAVEARERAEKVFDFRSNLARQHEWSEKTFGPGHRTQGVVDHIRRELVEVEKEPLDLTEWIDVVILALDGAWRAGYSPDEIIDALKSKQARNEARTWPDWRTADPNKAITHMSEPASAPTAGEGQ